MNFRFTYKKIQASIYLANILFSLHNVYVYSFKYMCAYCIILSILLSKHYCVHIILHLYYYSCFRLSLFRFIIFTNNGVHHEYRQYYRYHMHAHTYTHLFIYLVYCSCHFNCTLLMYFCTHMNLQLH